MNFEPPRPECSSFTSEEPDGRHCEEIERRLRSQRPRSPSLDLEAIEQAAQGGVDPGPVTLPDRNATRNGRLVAAFVGTWVAGAVAGALAMFAALGDLPSEQGDAGAGAKVAVQQQEPEGAEEAPKLVGQDTAACEASDQSLTSIRLAASLLNLDRSIGGQRSHMLRAGTHLSRMSLRRIGRETAPWQYVVDDHAENGAVRTETLPASTMTQDQLLQDLLENDLKSLL